MNSFNFIHLIPFIYEPQVAPGQSQAKARYNAVKGFELMSTELAVCKFNRYFDITSSFITILAEALDKFS